MPSSWFAPPKLDLEGKACDPTARKFINKIEPKRWIAFTVTILFLYISLYLVSSVFTWEKDDKKISKHYYDGLYTILLGTFLFLFGNFNNTFSYWFAIGIILGGFTIAIIGQLPGFQFSTGSLTSLTGVPLLVVSVFGLALVGSLIFTFLYYRKCELTPMFWAFLLIPIAILVLGYLCYTVDSDSVEFHLHHWQWAILFVFFARFPGIPWQSFLTGVFVGIIVDGISRYGPDTLFPPVTP